MTEKRYLPMIENERLAREFGRLQEHPDFQAFLRWLEEDVRPHAIQQFRGKLDHEILIKWSTVLQVIDDLIGMSKGAHDNWSRIVEAMKKPSTKWEG